MEKQAQVVFSEVIDINESERTSDVISDGSFKSLLLAQSTLDNLHKHGFKKPSPVQTKAIPPGMAGLDMLVQAKSGTGKTLVFAILAAENLKLSSNTVQKLVIAPTREIAIQIGETIQKLATKGVRIAILTGGTPVDKERLKRGVHIVVGTTGRLCQLVNEKFLNLNSLSLFVLDEADKMMTSAFEKDVNFLYSCVPSMRQVAVFSATYPPHLASSLTPFLRSPIHVRLNANDVQLIGVKQFVSICLDADPIHAAITAFTSIQFKQAFLFCNRAEECPLIVDRLMEKGIESAAISAQLEQSLREDVIKRLKANKIKVLVSTDLTARGVDADNADLVINLEAPFDVETYFHRIGRAARYGGQGASLTILPTRKSVSRFSYLVRDGGITAKMVSMDALSPTLITNRSFFDDCSLFAPQLRNRRIGIEEENSTTRDYDETNDKIIKYCEDDNLVAPDFSAMLNKAMILSSTLKKNDMVIHEMKTEKEKKFKFVPSRAKKSTKYYMKGEMISIRDAFTSAQWKKYANWKFDVKNEPFTMEECEENVEDTKYRKGKHVVPMLTSVVCTPCKGLREYTRRDLIAVCKSKPAKVWRAYAEIQWNLYEDPFVDDQSMRCSFTDRIRIQRQREKAERDKVMAERNASRLRLISMGTSVSPFKEWKGLFEEYCNHMKEEMDNTKERPCRGAVVNRRREKEEYRRKVEETMRSMEKVERNYEYALNMALKGLKEEGIQTELEMRIKCHNPSDTNGVKTEEKNEKEAEFNVDEEDDNDGKNDYDEIAEDFMHTRLYSSHNRNFEFVRVFHAYLSSMSTLRR